MLATLAVVLPVFALIAAGAVAGRTGVLGLHATGALSRFVVYLALPAVMFDVVAHARWADLWQPGFIAAFGGSTAVVFAVTILLRRTAGRPLADTAIDGLNAAYANTGFLGFPLVAATYGSAGVAPMFIAAILTVCVLFATAIVLIEVGIQAGARPRVLAFTVVRSLSRNPLLVAPVLGALVPIAGLSVPAPADAFLKLLGAAASPCALVSLGLFLAERRPAGARSLRSTALLCACKLALHPALAWILAVPVLGLDPLAAHVAVLAAALPTGTGPFMLAEFYGRGAAVTGDTVLASTVLSVLTVSACVALLA